MPRADVLDPAILREFHRDIPTILVGCQGATMEGEVLSGLDNSWPFVALYYSCLVNFPFGSLLALCLSLLIGRGRPE